MSKQVLDVQQMQHLQELGLDTNNAYMCWIVDESMKYKPFISLSSDAIEHVDAITSAIPTFTLQDIFDLLPKEISKEGCTWSAYLYIDHENNRVAYGNTDRYGFEIYHEEPICDDIIDAAYEMLCWCIENGYVETKETMRYE